MSFSFDNSALDGLMLSHEGVHRLPDGRSNVTAASVTRLSNREKHFGSRSKTICTGGIYRMSLKT
jgi:hypothetical protein